MTHPYLCTAVYTHIALYGTHSCAHTHTHTWSTVCCNNLMEAPAGRKRFSFSISLKGRTETCVFKGRWAWLMRPSPARSNVIFELLLVLFYGLELHSCWWQMVFLVWLCGMNRLISVVCMSMKTDPVILNCYPILSHPTLYFNHTLGIT